MRSLYSEGIPFSATPNSPTRSFDMFWVVSRETSFDVNRSIVFSWSTRFGFCVSINNTYLVRSRGSPCIFQSWLSPEFRTPKVRAVQKQSFILVPAGSGFPIVSRSTDRSQPPKCQEEPQAPGGLEEVAEPRSRALLRACAQVL